MLFLKTSQNCNGRLWKQLLLDDFMQQEHLKQSIPDSDPEETAIKFPIYMYIYIWGFNKTLQY